MVTSRHRSSTTSANSSPATRIPKPQLEEWTTREKLCLASMAIKYNNSWNSVARHMQAFAEKERPEGWSNQKTCAAQFDKLMNELGVDKRPKRNEPSDASSSVIYKKMAERRISELEEKAKEQRKAWLTLCNELEAIKVDGASKTSDEASNSKPVADQQPEHQLQTRLQQKNKIAVVAASVTASKTAQSPKQANESEKPPTRALTRRESSRQNLEKILAVLCQEASENKLLSQLTRPSRDVESSLGSYDKLILKHVDMSTISDRLGGEVEDPYAVMNDFLLLFQNATTYYPVDHPTHKIAVELREKLVPQWERSLLGRASRSRH